MDVSKEKIVSLIPISKIKNEKTIKNLISLTIKILVLAIIFYIFFGVVFGLKRMETSFMSPNITEGDLLLYYKIEKNFELSDVVIVKNENKKNVYRIVAKEGQTVDISEDGKLLIDEYPEEHLAFYETTKNENSEIVFPYTVEAGKYFIMNDYRLEKNDSRVFGTISVDSIIGKVIGRLQIRNI